tara:strand:- start:395 stop:895 length:501 start_codon:yes stop_codon:yes gene_type:complete
MERPEIDWEDTDTLAAGVVGPQGRRVFFIQACRDKRIVSLKLEKQQIAGLAEFLESVLKDLPPSDKTENEIENMQTEFFDPGEPDWVIGSLGVSYDQSTDRLILLIEELVRDEDLQPATARFPLRRSLILPFIEQARIMVAAGRPPCPFCGAPLDPLADGWCPCVN